MGNNKVKTQKPKVVEMQKTTKLTKAQKDLNHEPQVKLSEGIPMTIEWQRKIYGIQ